METAEGQDAKWSYAKDHLDTIADDSSSTTLYLTGLNTAFAASKPWFTASGHVDKYTDSDHLILGFFIEDGFFQEFERTNCFTNWPWGVDVCDVFFLGMNNMAYEYIIETNMTRAGIVTVDFPGAALIELFIDLNYNYVILDITPPTAVCKDMTVSLGGDGTVTITGDDIDNGSWDNGLIAYRIPSQDKFTCEDVDQSPIDVTLTVYDSRFNSDSCSSLVTVEEGGPVISLNGAQNVHLACNEVYEEPGATATDACDGLSIDVDITGPTIDPTVSGIYQMTYSAVDSDNNTTNTIRSVYVGYFTPPEMTLNGPNPLDVECGDTYAEYWATAIDDCDGDVSENIFVQSTDLPEDYINIPITQPGEYYISYLASDARYNYAWIDRTVVVSDTNAPFITLAGDDPFYILADQAYSLPGAAAFDVCEGVDYTDSIQVDSSAIDPSTWALIRSYIR
jgi:hypothetical protein